MATAVKPGVSGGVSVAPLTATLPTSATATATGFTNLGHISDAGVKRSIKHDTDTVKDWQGNVVCILDKGKTETFKFVMLDTTDVNVLKVIYGDSKVTGDLTAGITAKSGADAPAGHEYVIDMVMSDSVIQRIAIPNAIVTDIGEISYVGSDVMGYEVTLTGLADSSGQTAYDYTIKKTS